MNGLGWVLMVTLLGPGGGQGWGRYADRLLVTGFGTKEVCDIWNESAGKAWRADATTDGLKVVTACVREDRVPGQGWGMV